MAQELQAAGIRELFCWEGRTSEVEFLLETPSGIIPWEVKSGRIRQAKSLKTFEERYHPEMSIILSPGNVKKQGSRWQVPVYAAGKLASLITRIHI